MCAAGFVPLISQRATGKLFGLGVGKEKIGHRGKNSKNQLQVCWSSPFWELQALNGGHIKQYFCEKHGVKAFSRRRSQFSVDYCTCSLLHGAAGDLK